MRLPDKAEQTLATKRETGAQFGFIKRIRLLPFGNFPIKRLGANAEFGSEPNSLSLGGRVPRHAVHASRRSATVFIDRISACKRAF